MTEMNLPIKNGVPAELGARGKHHVGPHDVLRHLAVRRQRLVQQAVLEQRGQAGRRRDCGQYSALSLAPALALASVGDEAELAALVPLVQVNHDL